ncbi:collagen alpha-1(I) chain-like [Branchiostoma lanceolatum]|uniref:collagen alpha-1(I) chain-like n=1 Tax=Branchiostoma lanceolatum TaxID=7740 RepID=UPI00345589F0
MDALVQYDSSSSDEEEGRPPSAARQAKSAKRASSKSGGKKAKVAAAEVSQNANVQVQNPAGYSNDWQAMGYAQQGYGQTWPQGYDYSQYAQAYGQWGDYQQWANYYAGYGQQQQYGTQASMQPPPVPQPTSSVGQSTTTASSTSDVTPQPPPPSGPPSEKPPLPTGAPPAQLTSASTTGQQSEAKTPASQSQTTSATSSGVDSQVSTAGQGQAGSQDTSSGQASMDPNMMWNNMWNYQQYDPQAWSQYYAGQGYQDPNMAMGQWGQWGQQWQNWQQQQQQQGTADQTGQQKQQQTQQQGGYQATSQAATSDTGQKPPPQGPPPQGPPPHGPPPGLNGQDQWQRPDWQQTWHPGQMGQRPPGPMDQGPRMRMRHMGPMDHGQRPRHRGPMDGPRHRHPPPMGQGPRMRHPGPMEHGPRGPRGPMEPGQRPRHHGPMDQRPRHPGGMDQRPRHRHPGPMDFGQRPRYPGGMDQRPRHPPPMDKAQQPRFPGSADQGPRPMEQGQRPRNPGAMDQGPRPRFPGPMDQSQRPRHPSPQGPRGRAPNTGEGKDSRWSGQPWQRDNRRPKDQDDQEEDQESDKPQKKQEPATEEKSKPALSLSERLKMIAESKTPHTASSSHLASRATPSEKDKKKGTDEKGNANYVPLGFNKLQQMSQGGDDGREGRGPRGERGGRGDRGGSGGRGGRDDRGGRRSRFGQDDEPRGSSWGRDRNQPSYRSGRDGRPDREGRDRDSRSDRDGRPSRFSHDSRDRQGDSQQERRGSRFSDGPPSHGEQSKPGGEGNARSNTDGKQSRWETPRSTGTNEPQNQPKSRTKWGSETTDGKKGPSNTLLPDPAGPPGGGGGSHQGNPPSLFDIQVQPSSNLRQGQGQAGQQQWGQRAEQESNPPGPRGSPSAGPRGPSPSGPRGPSPSGPRGPPPPGPRGPPPPQFQGHHQGNWSQQNFGSPEGQGGGMKRESSNDSQFSPSEGGPGIRPYMPKRARLEPDGSPSNPSPAGMVLQDTTMAVAQDIFEPYPKIVFALGKAVQSKIPEKRLVDLQGHTGPVNTVEWCKADCSHLLLSSSMDRTVRVWDAIGDAKCVRTLTNHRAGVKMAAWTTDKKVLSCSFDKTAQLTDPQTGQTVTTFPHSNFVTVVRVHPQEHNLFLTGSTDIIQAWDSRTGKAVRDFKCKFGSVLDLAFFPSGKSFISSADVVARDSADKTIMVWDFNSGSKLSNQIFHERYSCPSVAVHPSEPNFIAQTNGDYIALFSTSRPYAMDKTVRFEGHKVQGYRIGCEFTPDGQMIVTGSGDGKVHFFNYYSGETARELNVYTNPCTDVKSHPVLSSTLATCSWGGQVSVWQ